MMLSIMILSNLQRFFSVCFTFVSICYLVGNDVGNDVNFLSVDELSNSCPLSKRCFMSN